MISSLATSRLTILPHIGEIRDRAGKSYEVLTEVMPQDLPIRPEVVPLWIVVLSACAGAIILMLLVAALYAVSCITSFISLVRLLFSKTNSSVDSSNVTGQVNPQRSSL